jgi:hypothetical protein
VKILVPNPLLRYSVERLLFEANPMGTRYFRDTHFNKMIFLIYESLKDEKIDLKLPYCWYKHGTLIHQQSFYTQVGRPLDFYITNDSSTRKISHIPKNDLESDIKDVIDAVVIKVVSKYKQTKHRFIKGYIHQLLDDDYFYAPYEFQRIFKRHFEKYLTDFRTPVRKQIPRHISFDPDEIESINEYLNELIRTFPDDMEYLSETYQEWDDTARLCLDCDQDLFLNLVDDFWAIFSKYLRISRFENIPEAEILRWRSKLSSAEFPEYENQLAIERKRLLKIWNSGFAPNDNTMNIIKKMNQISFEGAVRWK